MSSGKKTAPSGILSSIMYFSKVLLPLAEEFVLLLMENCTFAVLEISDEIYPGLFTSSSPPYTTVPSEVFQLGE